MLYNFILILIFINYTYGYSIAVIGSTGNLGKYVISELCKNNMKIKILNRHNNSSNIINNYKRFKNIEIINGNINDLNSIVKLLTNTDTCISLQGSNRKSKLFDIIRYNNDLSHPIYVNYIGIRNIIEAAKITNTKHIIRITGNGENPWSLTSIIINLLGSMSKAWNYAGECELRESNITYTIIRPGIMHHDIDLDFSLILRDNGNNIPIKKISYYNIAKLCIYSITHPNVKNTTLTAMTTDVGLGKSSWLPLLRNVNKDNKNFPNKIITILNHYISVYFISFILLSIFIIILNNIINYIKYII